MKVSVIVPVYNVQQYVRKCIESIINQTYEDIELILVDDGSTDTSGEICDKYACSDSRIKVIHQTNGGLSVARNAGLDVAKGSFITFVDSDDYIHKDMLDTMVKKACEKKADITICNCYFIDLSGNTIEHDSTIRNEMVISQDNMMELLSKEWLPAVVSWCKLYNRDVFNNLRFPVGKIYEDEFLAHRIMAQAEKILIIPQFFYYYLQRKGSLSKDNFSIKKFDRIEALLDRSDFYKAAKKDKYAFCSLVNAILELTIYWKHRKNIVFEELFDKYRNSLLIRCKNTHYYPSEFKYSLVVFLFRYNFPLLRVLIRMAFKKKREY